MFYSFLLLLFCGPILVGRVDWSTDVNGATNSTVTERAVVVNKTYINLTQPSFASQIRREIGADSGVQVVEPIYRVQNQIMIPTTSLSHHQTPNKEKIETLKGN